MQNEMGCGSMGVRKTLERRFVKVENFLQQYGNHVWVKLL